MYRLLILILALLCSPLAACGRKREPAREANSPLDELRERRELYRSIAPRDWAVSQECDALLFTALTQVGLGEQGAVELAESEPGRWHRKAALDYASSCSSDISRDMFMGLFTWIWEYKRLDVAERLWEYGTAHNWKMGEERDFANHFDRVYFRPGTVGLLAELIYKLGGESHWERSLLTVNPLSTEPGFQSHLSLLSLHLLGEMHGGLTAGELSTLTDILVHMNGNPLAHALYHKYTDGDQSRAVQLLLSIWPSDRLPTERDWKESWRTQRSDGDTGFQPGDSDEPHSGGDFLFVCRVILGNS